MSRRSERTEWDGLHDALLEVPWWVGPLVATVLFAGMRVAGHYLATSESSGVKVGLLFAGVWNLIAWVVAGCVIFVWIGAEIEKFGRRRRLDRQTGLDSIRSLGWDEFEELVAEAYRRQGYSVQVCGSRGGAGDGGVDAILRRLDEVVLVQCKQWRAFKVGVKEVRELLGVVASEGATKGILVTSGRFTSEARSFAAQNLIEPVDGDALRVLVNSVRGDRATAAPAAKTLRPASNPAAVVCPKCGAAMILRTARQGKRAGSQFWGCSQYPACRGTTPP